MENQNDIPVVTGEDLRKVFAPYIGSEIVAEYNEDYPICKGYLTGIHGEFGAEIQFLPDGNAEEEPEYRDFDKCQLLLTPVEEISDADALRLAKMYGWDEDANPFGGPDVKIPDKDVIETIKYHATGLEFSFKEIDTLRAWGYDCGYGSIPSLIEAKIAVKKEVKNG